MVLARQFRKSARLAQHQLTTAQQLRLDHRIDIAPRQVSERHSHIGGLCSRSNFGLEVTADVSHTAERDFPKEGLLAVIGALGVSSVQKRIGSRSYAMITGLVIYGLCIATAGLLRADPAEGFPIGTPAGPPAVVTGSGLGHLIAGGIGFLGLIVACLACARRSARTGESVWAACSAAIGVYYLVAFAGIASGAGNPVINIAFTVAVVLGWGG